MADIRHLHVHISAHVDGEVPRTMNVDRPIPPDYNDEDTQALTRRTIEDTAFLLTSELYGRSPTRNALVAATARLKALEAITESLPDGSEKDRLRLIFLLTNDEATAQYGDDFDGP